MTAPHVYRCDKCGAEQHLEVRAREVWCSCKARKPMVEVQPLPIGSAK